MVEAIANSPAVEAVGWALIQFAWQGTLVAAAAGLALLIFSRANAQVRYGIACAALLAMVALPIGTAVRSYERTAPGASTGTEAGPGVPLEDVVSIVDLPNPGHGAPIDGARADSPAFDFEAWLPTIVIAWFIGVLALTLRLTGGWMLVRRMRRHGEAVSASVSGLVDGISRRVRLSRPVRALESGLVEVPTLVGWIRPVIMLPATAATGLSAEELEAVIAHELAHVRRQDYLVNLFQTLAETLLFYHPAVWWVSSRIRAEREHAADDLAVAACGDALLYAKALSKLEGSRTPMGLAVGATGGSLLGRIRRILGEPSRSNRPVSAGLALVTVLAILVFGMSGPQVTTAAEQETPGAPETAAIEITAEPALLPEPESVEPERVALAGLEAEGVEPATPLEETEAALPEEPESEAAAEASAETLSTFLRFSAPPGAAISFVPPQTSLEEISEVARAGQDAVRSLLVRSGAGYLGLGIDDGPDRGIVVRSVAGESPAAEAGIEVDDLITAFNGTPVVGTVQFMRLVSETPAGRTVEVTLERGGLEQRVDVTVAERQNRIAKVSPFSYDGSGDGIVSSIPFANVLAGVLSGPAARLGLAVDGMTPELREFFGAARDEGILVVGIEDDSIAGDAGIRVGDVIVAVDGNRVDTAGNLMSLSRAVLATGNSITITVMRDRIAVDVVVEPSADE